MGSFESWSAAFDFLAERAKEDPFVFVFDEFPYAALRNEALPSALQIAIDHKFKNTGLFMILCGSNQGFMESRVLGRKSPLFGRCTAQMRILPLGYTDARQMLGDMDAQDSFRFYGCFGGVPYYLSQVDPEKSLRENLARLYFARLGFYTRNPWGCLGRGSRNRLSIARFCAQYPRVQIEPTSWRERQGWRQQACRNSSRSSLTWDLLSAWCLLAKTRKRASAESTA